MRISSFAMLTVLLAGLSVRADDRSPVESLVLRGLNQGAMIDSDHEVDPLPSSSITLAELESTAIAGHPSIAIARNRIDAARGQWLQVGLNPNPSLQYQGDEIGNEDDAGLHSIGVSQTIVTANKLELARQTQHQVIEKQRALLQLVELQVLTRVRSAYFIALVAQQRADLTDEMFQLARRSVDSVESLYQAEEVSKVSLLQARVEAERARMAADVAATQSTAANRALAAAVGIDNLPAERIAGDLEDDLVEQPWSELLAEIQAASPEIATVGSELQRARWALQQACAGAVPNVTGQVGIGRDSATDDIFARVGISMPLPIYNWNQGNIRSARAEIRAAEATMDQTKRDLQSRLADTVGRYRAARRRYLRIQQQILPDAEETFDLSREAFEAGESSYLQLMAAQRTLIQTRLQMLEALGQARQSGAQIDGLLVTLAN